MMTTIDDGVKAYIKKIMSQLSKWMSRSKISKLVVVITSKETGEHVERWQFDVRYPHIPSLSFTYLMLSRSTSSATPPQKSAQPAAQPTKKTPTLLPRAQKKQTNQRKTSKRRSNPSSAKSLHP
jgi:mitotic spindle assembly checkpoint protein MAD2